MTDARIVGGQNWRRLPSDRFGMMNVVDNCIADLDSFVPARLPSFQDSSSLLLASDYGGQHSGAHYETYSYLLVCRDRFVVWREAQQALRARWLPDGRRLSYKSLGDSIKARAVPAFLAAADLLAGILVTFAISTQMKSIFAREGHILRTSTNLSEYQHWKPKPFERLYRITSLAAFLLSGLSQPGQSVVWLTDEDEIVGSKRHLKDFGTFFSGSPAGFVGCPRAKRA